MSEQLVRNSSAAWMWLVLASMLPCSNRKLTEHMIGHCILLEAHLSLLLHRFLARCHRLWTVSAPAVAAAPAATCSQHSKQEMYFALSVCCQNNANAQDL